MKTFIAILLYFSLLSIYSQSEKLIYYYDVDGSKISKKNYVEKSSRYKSLNKNYLSTTFENDTCYIKKLVKRKNYGKLKKSELDSLYKTINNTTKSNQKFTLIHYHPGRDGCNDGSISSNGIKNNIYNKQYLRRLKKDYKIYWIYKKDETLNFEKAKSIDWQIDKNQFIEKTFFKYHYLCNSFVIIDNDTGNYISIFGESGGQTVIEIAEEMKKIKN